MQVTRTSSFGHILSLPISPSYLTQLRGKHADILHIHEPFPLGDLAYLALGSNGRRQFNRLFIWWHSDIIRQKALLPFYAPLARRILRLADCIIVATPNHISSSYFLPAVEHKCRVVHYGVDLRRFEPTETSLSLTQEIRSYYEDPFLLLFVGRLVYYKGVEYLIEAMREVRNAHLVIVGDGPLKGKLKQMSCRCAPNRITFLPPQDEARLVALYRACDLFVLPSIACSEQFGIVQLEAMACEKAVITTDLPTGVTYVNQDGVTGLVVPQRNASALASTINSLLGDESLRNKLGRKGRKRIEMEFTLENMIREITTIYEEFASSGSLKAEVTATHLAPMLR